MPTEVVCERLALSLIVPVYNGEAFIGSTVREILAYLASLRQPVELIVVDDGSTDNTPTLLRDVLGTAPVPVKVKLLRFNENQGKGVAIASGMRAARGVRRVFIDADLAYPPSEIAGIDGALAAGADVAVASRVHRSSRVQVSPGAVRYFVIRYVVGRFLNWLVRLILLPGIRDSQAGLKGFTAAAAERLIAGWLPRGFSFDVALLYRARRLGMRVEQVPVLYRHEGEPTTVRYARDTAKVLRDLAQIRLRLVGERFERWGVVFRARLQGFATTSRMLVRNPTARAVLWATFGLSTLSLAIARLAVPSGRTAVASWLGSLFVVGLAAWRADVLHPPRPMRWFRSRTECGTLLVIVAAAAALRFLRLGDVPPMMHGDSAECGLAGLALLNGQVADLFDFSPWYLTPYLSFVPYAVSFMLTGVTTLGLRLSAPVLGVLLIIPLYFFMRDWFGRRAALLAAALLAVSHTAIHFSRIGLWNIQVLFYEVTAFALLVLGLRRNSALTITGAGMISGLALYSYTAGRLVPVVAVTFLLLRLTRSQWRRAARALVCYAGAMLVTAGPLALNYVKQPEALELDRTASVWVLAKQNRFHVETTLGTSHSIGILAEQAKRTLAGFVTRGDTSTQYGTEQPLLSPLAAALCLIGLAVAFRRWRQPRFLFVLVWSSFGLVLGSVFIIDPPSYTRLIALVPIPCILAAVGLEALLRIARRRVRVQRADALVVYALVVAQSAAFNLVGYYKFTQRMSQMSREWDVLKVVEKSGARYDYYLYTGPFLLADSPIFRLFSGGARTISAFTETDLPAGLARDAVFVLTPEFRPIGAAISRRFPGTEREVVDQAGVRQLLLYRCTSANGCRGGDP